MLRVIVLLLYNTVSSTDISIARGKPTGQDSIIGPYGSSQAVDGIYGTDVEVSGGAHTASLHPWWTVDLGKIYQINNVNVYNRDILQERLDNLYVEGFVEADPYFCDTRGNLCGFNPGPSGDVVSLICPNNTLARYLRLSGSEQMTLIEVDVFGQASIRKDCEDQRQTWRPRSGQRLTKSLVDLGVSPTPSDCLVSCLHRGLCSVFNFNVLDGSCTTTSHPVTDKDLAADSNWNVYYTC